MDVGEKVTAKGKLEKGSIFVSVAFSSVFITAWVSFIETILIAWVGIESTAITKKLLSIVLVNIFNFLLLLL